MMPLEAERLVNIYYVQDDNVTFGPTTMDN